MLVTDGDIKYLKEKHPDRRIHTPSARHQKVLMLHLRGLSNGAIARSLDMPAASVTTFLSSDTALALLDLYRTREFEDVRCTREQLTNMLFESYHKAGNAMEEIAAVREIGKLNGLYKSDEQKDARLVVTNVRQLERLSEAELVQLVGGRSPQLLEHDIVNDAVEAEWSAVEAEAGDEGGLDG